MNELHELIQNSFKIQTRTDTDLGVNLSGGIDSKLMMLTLDKMNNGQKKVKASSFYFDDEEYSERYDLQKFSSNINWKIDFFKITPEDIINNFDDIYDSQDEPFPGIPTIGKDLSGTCKSFRALSILIKLKSLHISSEKILKSSSLIFPIASNISFFNLFCVSPLVNEYIGCIDAKLFKLSELFDIKYLSGPGLIN